MSNDAKATAIEDAARDGWNAVIEYGELTESVPPVGYLHNWLLARAAELRNREAE